MCFIWFLAVPKVIHRLQWHSPNGMQNKHVGSRICHGYVTRWVFVSKLVARSWKFCLPTVIDEFMAISMGMFPLVAPYKSMLVFSVNFIWLQQKPLPTQSFWMPPLTLPAWNWKVVEIEFPWSHDSWLLKSNSPGPKSNFKFPFGSAWLDWAQLVSGPWIRA